MSGQTAGMPRNSEGEFLGVRGMPLMSGHVTNELVRDEDQRLQEEQKGQKGQESCPFCPFCSSCSQSISSPNRSK
jgi:hypothetical protein